MSNPRQQEKSAGQNAGYQNKQANNSQQQQPRKPGEKPEANRERGMENGKGAACDTRTVRE